MTTQWEVEKAKIKDSGFTATVAQAVHKHLNALEDNRKIRHTRWIWELLQNAHDASSTAHGKNLIVSIEYSPEELVFWHNGSGFEKEQIQRLIFHGSTKVEDEETKGQYGSGFLATHLLSSEIDVSGQLNDGKWFDFRLVRTPGSVEALRESMNQAWDDFNPSLSLQVPMPDPFTTRFGYPIIKDKEEKAAKAGIEELKQCAPYVVAFNEKFVRIDIKDHNETLSFEIVEQQSLNQGEIQQITVKESKNGKSRETKYLTAQGKKKTSVTVPLESNEDRSVCLPVKEIPRLFSAFPLVGTESFSFPAVINNWNFKPTEDRDGVSLGQSNSEANHINQAIIEEACGLLIYLIQFAVSKGWNHVHRWAEIPTIQNKDWLNTEWLRACIKEKLIKEVRKKLTFLTVTGSSIPPIKAAVPFSDNDKKVEVLWNLLSDLQEYSNKLPKRQEAIGWCNVVKSWMEICEDIQEFGESIDGCKLAGHVSKVVNGYRLANFQNLLQENVCAVDWLNRFYGFLLDDGRFDEIDSLNFILDQDGSFDRLSNLYRDQGIDDELKDIAELLKWSLRSKLRDTRLTSLKNKRGKADWNNASVVRDLIIDKLKERANDNLDTHFKEASTRLFAWVVSQEKWNFLRGFPVFTADGESIIDLPNPGHDSKPLLAPVRVWQEDLQQFKTLFPPKNILATEFFDTLPNLKAWLHLEEKGFIQRTMIIHRKEENLKELSLDVCEDKSDHKVVEHISTTDFIERVAIMDQVTDSKTLGHLFWRFLTEWLVKEDIQALETHEAKCESCEKHHIHFRGAWVLPVLNNKWLRPKGKQRFSVNAKSLADLLRDSEWEISSLKENPAASRLLEVMNVSLSDLKLGLMAENEEERNEVIDLGTELHQATDGDLRMAKKFVHLVREGKDLLQDFEDLRKQKHTIRENQNLGKQVEEWVGAVLKVEGFKVVPIHTGADFEIDLITLDVTKGDRKWLIEVKSARSQIVKMSSEQTKTALEKKEKFLLCVVPIPENTELDFQTVKQNMKFVKNIHKKFGDRVTKLCQSIKEQETLLNDTLDDTSSDVELDFERGRAEIRVKNSVWENEGIRLEDLIKHLK